MADIEKLIQDLESNFMAMRTQAANSLGKLKDQRAKSHLIKTLSDPEPAVRSEAAYALGEIGPAAKDAAPALKAMSTNSPDSYLRKMAAAALQSIENRKAKQP